MQLRKTSARFLRNSVGVVMFVGGALGSGLALAQSQEVLRNVVQLSATGSVEVDQDWLQMRLAATRDGNDAASVQKQLQQAVDAAMRSLRPQVQGQNLQVSSGSFGVYPRHGNDGKIKGWQDRAEVLLEGKDFARITQAAAQIEGMTVAGMDFGLSKEGRARVQEQAQAQAIDSFKARATQLARQFGFSGYSLREVSVNSQDAYPAPRMVRMNAMPMAAKAEAADGMAVEAGKAQVVVNVAGSVQLQ